MKTLTIETDIDTRVNNLVNEVEDLIDLRFGPAKGSGPFHRVIAKELCRLLKRRCDDKRGQP